MDECEGQQHVIRILSCQNHYQVLEIKIDASNEEIVAAYKKWARLVHPDKNHAHRANEAMEKVTKAREVLSDSTKRMLYDQLFMDAEIPAQPNQNVSDDEFFDINRDDDRDRNWWDHECRICLLVLLPVILLLLIPALVSLLKPYSICSLTPNAKFPIRKRTMAGKIPYYVTKNFKVELQDYYNGSLGNIEKEIKNAYKMKLKRACKRENEYKQYVLDAALNSPKNRYWYERVVEARSIETPSCYKLRFLADALNEPIDHMPKIWEYFSFLGNYF